jgi:hypothetical protein
LTQNNTKKLIDFIKENHLEVYKEFKKMLVLDFIIANEDRHSDNISIRIDKDGNWHFGIVYDNGNSMYFENKTTSGINEDVRCKFSGHLSNKEIMLQHITSYNDLSFINEKTANDIIAMIQTVYGKSNMTNERISALRESVEEKMNFLVQYKEQLYQKHIEQEEIR